MMLGATAFEGVVCNSSPDICASDDFARMGLTPAPSTSRLKSRRFMTLPHSCAYLLTADGRQPMRQIYSIYVVERNATYLQDHIYGMMLWYGSNMGDCSQSMCSDLCY